MERLKFSLNEADVLVLGDISYFEDLNYCGKAVLLPVLCWFWGILMFSCPAHVLIGIYIITET